MSISREEYDLRLVDTFRKSLFIYWTSLLTINGLLLTIFSAEAISSTGDVSVLIYILIGFSILSIWLLIWNIRIIKLNYYELGRVEENWPDPPQEEIQKAQSKEELSELMDRYSERYRQESMGKARARQEWMMKREKTVEVLLVFETVLVVAALIVQA